MTKTIAISGKAITKLTTPQLLKGGMYLTWGASLLLLVATLFGVQAQRHAIKTVGKDSAPSIITAQRIKDGLAGMDANAVNELLVKSGQNPEAIKGYEERRQKLAERLVAAAENITYGDAERKPIQTLQLAVGDYMMQIQRAKDFNERGDANGVLMSYREAARIMDKTLLPAADALDKANSEELEQTYLAERFASGRSLFIIILFGLLLIGVLVALQVFLSHRMRRLLNPMLLAATAIAIVFVGYTTRAFLLASHQLKVAKEDAFVSVHALRQSRALAYSANADESRYLLDAALASTHQQAFFTKAAEIAKVPSGQTFEAVATAAAQGQKVEGFTGFLGEELNNITFPGEREAAVATLSTFGTYLNIDQQIRQLQQSGKHAQAIALCTGYNPGQSNWAFNRFLDAHQKTFDINMAAFEDAIAQGFKDVDGFEVVTPIVTVAIAGLTLFGLLPRIKEYSE
ncbi:MAG TPA: hypothetical protein V6C85_31545 [Allocoleopsis sp.]